jgi:hypothetical protein
MLTSRRDYLMRVIDEVTRLLARVVFKRKGGEDREALETVVVGFQRLFQLDADQIFLLTPDQHYTMLTEDEPSEFARDKVLLYAALSAEAGTIYARQGNQAMARATRINALRFSLKARADFPTEGMPDYAPDPKDLIALLSDQPLDAETAALVTKAKPAL